MTLLGAQRLRLARWSSSSSSMVVAGGVVGIVVVNLFRLREGRLDDGGVVVVDFDDVGASDGMEASHSTTRASLMAAACN